MPEHTTGTREEWQAARDELAKLEAEQAERNEEIKKKRLELPWVPVEKEYVFDTEDGKKTLAELFDGRSQLLAYNVMFGPDYTLGACPGCTSLADGLDGSLVHLNHRDVTLICFSRAPIDRLTAYKERMGWEFPYVSTYDTDFPFDFGLAMTEEQAQQIPEVKEMIENPPDWLAGVVAAGRRRAQGRAARGPELDRVRARERDRLPHLHGDGARSVRRAVLQLPARADAEGAARRASQPGGRTSTRAETRRGSERLDVKFVRGRGCRLGTLPGRLRALAQAPSLRSAVRQAVRARTGAARRPPTGRSPRGTGRLVPGAGEIAERLGDDRPRLVRQRRELGARGIERLQRVHPRAEPERPRVALARVAERPDGRPVGRRDRHLHRLLDVVAPRSQPK